MRAVEPITRWIEGAKRGDDSAIQALWERYFEKLVRFAKGKLTKSRGRVADEEDVALSAFKSFCLAARRGRFPDLKDRHGLWKLLLRMTARKAVDQRRRDSRYRRRVLGESAVQAGGDDAERQWLVDVISKEPGPSEAAEYAEAFRRLIAFLRDSQLEAVALASFEGFNNKEIATKLNVSLRTVERQLQLIRKKWEGKRGG